MQWLQGVWRWGALASILLPGAVGCPGDEPPTDTFEVERGSVESGTAGAGTRLPPRPSASGGVDEPVATAPDAGDLGSDARPAACDDDCAGDEDCGGDETCVQFALGAKCAPTDCSDCELGCIFDLATCTFTRCLAEPPPDAPAGCGQPCGSAADCAEGQTCIDVFGLGECAPIQCGSCDGLCDYDPRSCRFDFCYRDVGGVTDYCGHQF